MRNINFLGIHSSPVKNGNTAYLLDYALGEASKVEGVITERVALAGLKITDCKHCNWCIKNQTGEKLYAIEDDVLPLLQKIRDSDVLLLVSPVYFARLSGMKACLLDRTRCFIFSKEKHLALKDKVGIAKAVGWMGNAGMESTLASVHHAFLIQEMQTPSVHSAGAMLGAGAVSGLPNADLSTKEDRPSIIKDTQALKAAGMLISAA